MTVVSVKIFEANSNRLVTQTDLLTHISYVYTTVEFHRFNENTFQIQSDALARIVVRDELDVILNADQLTTQLSNEDVVIARPNTEFPAWESIKQQPTKPR